MLRVRQRRMLQSKTEKENDDMREGSNFSDVMEERNSPKSPEGFNTGVNVRSHWLFGSPALSSSSSSSSSRDTTPEEATSETLLRGS